MDTITEQFKITAEKFAQRPALKFKYQGTYISVSFFELQKRVKQMAAGLKALGIGKGDRIAILSENRTEWVRIDLATLMLGAASVPIHTTLSAKIIAHILNDSGSKIILVSTQELFNKLQLVLKELRTIEKIIYIDLDDTKVNDKLISIDQVMKMGESGAEKIQDQASPDDIASIVYTSGTTAMPKGVMLTHKNFITNARSSAKAVLVDEHDIFLSFLPLSHVFERTAGYYAALICQGSCIAYAQSIKQLKNNLSEVKPTMLIAVPRIFERIYDGLWDKVRAGSPLKRKIFNWALKQQPGTFQHRIADILVFKKIQKAFGGNLRLAISGGAALNHKLAKFFSKIGITILEGYGLTETAPVITCNRPTNIKFGTVGQKLDGVELKIADDKEILTRGACVMKGYWHNDALTEEAIDSDGWFHTGDLGFINSEGFLVIIGRKKEMIALSTGKIAWPEQIEMILNDDRYISQSMVVGNGKSHLTALIVPDFTEVTSYATELGLPKKPARSATHSVADGEPGELIKEEKLRAVFKQRLDKININLADWEEVRNFVLLSKEFSQEREELTPTLKLRRKIIEQNNAKVIANLYPQK